MKAGNIIKSILILTGVFYFSGAQAQSVEYDDLYFNKEDRKQQKELKSKAKAPVVNANDRSDVPLSTEEYSSKNVNPEYLARYNASQETTIDADEYDNNEYSADDYYVETDERIQNNQSELMQSSYANNMNRPDYYRYPSRNSYWNSGFGYGGLSPYYAPAGWNVGFGYNFGSYYGAPYSRYNVMMSWNSGGYGFYDPWYDPWYGGMYDPWYGGWGYSPYAYRNPWRYGYGAYYGYNSFYYPRYNYVTIIERNNLTYGRRDSRSSSVSTRSTGTRSSANMVNNNTRSRVASTSTSTTNNRVAKDYYGSQNEIYSSRTRSVDTRSNVNSRNTADIRTIDRSTSSSQSRIANTSSRSSAATVERPTRSSSNSYSNSRNYNTNTNRSSGNTYSAPSRSNSNYSQPSRSSSNYSQPSRSSSGSSYSAPSRSSSPSSSSPSRSSGSSSSPSRSSSRSGR